MQTLDCPHCGKPIRFVGPGELEREYGLAPNSVTHYKGTGRFPKAVLEYQKAHVYLEDDILKFKSDKLSRDLGGVVDKLMNDMKHLTPDDRAQARKLLEERLLNGDEPPKPTRKRTTRKRDSSSPRKGKGGLEGA